MMASLMISGPIEIGRARLEDFQIHRMKHEWKKNLIINPKRVEIMLTLVDLTNRLSKLKKSPEFKNLPNEDKMLIGSTCGSLAKELLSIITNLEYSNKLHTFIT
jgi:hypothetical protein